MSQYFAKPKSLYSDIKFEGNLCNYATKKLK